MTGSLLTCVACQKALPPGGGANFCPACGQRQGNTTPLSQGERRPVTILFADLASFTAVSENADPEDVIDMLNHVFTRLMVECDREGGYLDKTVGDQLMVLFGAPRAHEDDPVRAVRAALAMQVAMEELAPVMREKVGVACKLNIGIHTGNVVWGQAGPTGKTTPTVIGDAVNLAARLQQAAKDGQIFVSEAVYLRTRRIFEFKVLDPIMVKNKTGSIPLYAPLHLYQRLTTGHESIETHIPLVERDLELQSLHAFWSRAVAGTPQLVLLRGDAGLGKSRLLTEFANSLDTYAVDKQPLVLHANYKSTSHDDYHPLADLLYQLFGLTAEDTDLIYRRKIEDRARILSLNEPRFVPLMGYLLGWYRDDPRLAGSEANLDSLREYSIDIVVNVFLKQSSHRPSLLIIDDLQWADPDILKWLTQLNIAIEAIRQDILRTSYRLLVLLASRPHSENLAELPATLNSLTLAPLKDLARRDLIEHLLPGRGLPLALVERLSQESEGNPLYLVEAARSLIQSRQLMRENGTWHLTRPDNQLELPQSIEGLIMARLDALDPNTRTLLQYAAVIGTEFSYSMLAAICPVEDLDDRLADLEQRGLITALSPGGENAARSFAFTNTMMRKVAYQNILRKTRRELHNRIAQQTEAEIASGQEDLVRLAHHYAAGGDQEKLIAYNWLVGQCALDEFKFEEAFHHLQLAWNTLRAIPSPNGDIYLNVANTLGDAATFCGKFTEAELCYEAVKEWVGDETGELAPLNYRVGRLHFYQGNVEVAQSYFEQALKLAPDNLTLKAQIEAEMRLLGDG